VARFEKDLYGDGNGVNLNDVEIGSLEKLVLETD
jgi:hypothetical protein